MLEADIAVTTVPRGLDVPGLMTRDLADEGFRDRIDPFLVISQFDMTGPVFPPHPHAGFSVATYIFPESEIGFWNQDTLGNVNPVTPGSLYLIVAGAGVMHEETVSRSGRHATGFQIWIDHAAVHREVTPRAFHLAASDVPVTARDGVTRRILLGTSGGVASPVDTPTAVRLVDVEMKPGSTLREPISPNETGFAWIRSGEIEAAGRSVPADAVLFADDGGLTATSESGARLTVFAGRPLRQPAVPAGPFVASNATQAAMFRDRYAKGLMGKLDPFDQGALDRAHDMGLRTGDRKCLQDHSPRSSPASS
ncbi:pirin family protein [Oricola sp.]|uniref:pirin family protein n=1 Tax=Oricola sp. TaxID=1979950 RepID=UPI003514AEF8